MTSDRELEASREGSKYLEERGSLQKEKGAV
jgi:hypothetical protein